MFGIGSSKKKEIDAAEREAEREAYRKRELEAQTEAKKEFRKYMSGLDDRDLRLVLALVYLEHAALIRAGDYRRDYLNEQWIEELLKERESEKSGNAQAE